MSKNIKATQIRDKDKIQSLDKGDFVTHGKFKVEVNDTVCAMGGDWCIDGVVKSWLTDHQYNVKFGTRIFWGPKYIVEGDLYDYLNRRNIVGIK